MKHAIANPDSNVIANLVKQVTANPVKHMIECDNLWIREKAKTKRTLLSYTGI
jgi:capsular polysaccharide biosynthesis protein